ncbi:MAG TPA: hypothetical protein VMF56_05615 [Acidobacteriaceae bacterium]|nr:hypothetical protein [Acidobacteriaceae bacterium]
MKLNHLRHLCLTFVVAVGFSGAMCAQSISYSTFDVPEAAPATPGSLSVEGINAAGLIVGYLLDASGNTDGWMRDTEGNITLLDDPLNTSSPFVTEAYAVNDQDMIAGYFFDSSASLYYGFFYESGRYITYSAPGQPTGTDTAIGAINNHRQFCGFVLSPPYTTYQAFVSINGALTLFSVDGSSDTECVGINNLNTSVGLYTDSSGVYHGWSRDASGVITTFDVPGAASVLGAAPCTGGNAAGTVPDGINDKGYISGHYWDASYNEHGFVRSPNGKFVPLNVPDAYQTAGGGINLGGTVVGHYSDTSCNNAGYTATLP